MPNNRKITKKTIKGKEGLHPGSRKAGQLNRVNLRTSKLQSQAKLRKGLTGSKLHRPVFFLHSLSSPNPLTLPSLRALVSDVYLTRNDPRILELEQERRAGRPKSKELLELEQVRQREMAEWETGIEVPDLTHGPTTKLLYSLLLSETRLQHSHIDLCRHVRLFQNASAEVVISKRGRTENMGLGESEGVGEDWTHDGREEVKGMHVE